MNPARARDFARALGVLAKTDAIDARMLAQMGRVLPLEMSAMPMQTASACRASIAAATSW